MGTNLFFFVRAVICCIFWCRETNLTPSLVSTE
jgi:hypothetical protein